MRRVRSQFPILTGFVLAAFVLSAVVGASGASAAKGVIQTFGSAGTGPGQFSNAADGLRAVAVDQASGDVYVVDGGNHRVQRFTGSGQYVSQLGSGTAGAIGGAFNSPFGVAVDPADSSVYVTDGLNLRVQKFSSVGLFIRAWGWDTIIPTGPPPNDNGTGFEVCDTTTIPANMALDCKAGTTGSGDGQFAGTHQFTGAPAVDPNTGAVYVADPGAAGVNGRRVQRFNGATGAFEGRWGGTGTGLGQFGGNLAGAASPHRLAVDSAGAVYVVDRGRTSSVPGRVQKCVPSGVAPAVTATCSLFASYPDGGPVAIAIDPSNDHVLVARRSGDGSTEFVVDEFTSLGGAPLQTHGAGAGMALNVGGNNTINVSAGLAVHGGSGRIYFSFPSSSSPRVWVLDDVPAPSVEVGEATDVTADTARLNATIVPAATGPTGVRTFYRFEYSSNNGIDWVRANPSDVDLGNGSGAGDPGACPAGNPPTCEVSLELDDLDTGKTYRVRAVARTELGGASVTVEGPSFDTPDAAPIATTGPAIWSSPADTEPTLLLTGGVHPRGLATTYQFEYVTAAEYAESGFQHAAKVPAVAGDAGSARRLSTVHHSVAGLDPGVAYRYRLVADNVVGSASGQPRAVDPPEDGDRFYEWVSAGESWGLGVAEEAIAAIADDGGRAMFAARAFGDPPSVPNILTYHVSERGDDGWEPRSAAFPPPAWAYGIGGNIASYMAAGDLGSFMVPESEPHERQRAEIRWTRTWLDGSRQPATDLIRPLGLKGQPHFGASYHAAGAASDLTSFAFVASSPGTHPRLLADEPQIADNDNVPRSHLYLLSGGGPGPMALDVANRLSDTSPGVRGPVLGGVCGAGLGARLRGTDGAVDSAYRAVSNDGRVIHFSSLPDAPDTGDCNESLPKRLFKRVDGQTTVAVSESRCDRGIENPCAGTGDDLYQAASVDGQVSIFSSPRQLTNSDLDVATGFASGCRGALGTGCDLYVHDSDPPAGQPELAHASEGEVTPGSGANVTGFLDSARDGSRVYFTAGGVLTGANARGESPAPSGRNVYVYQRDEDHPEGRIEFVATVALGDMAGMFFALSEEGDGRYLLFTTGAALVDSDLDAAADVYRYDDADGTVMCLSCVGSADADSYTSARPGMSLSRSHEDQAARPAVSDVSRVAFSTSEGLVEDDVNGALDVYLWEEGKGVSLMSGGTGPRGVVSTLGGYGAWVTSGSGDSVFFVTEAPLVDADRNGRADVYAARVGGGFPASVEVEGDCDAAGGGCQGGGSGPATGPATSTRRSGTGNAEARDRKAVAVAGLSAAQRRRASRSGVLRLRVRANQAGVVSAFARARIGRRARPVGRGSVRLPRAGTAQLTVRLSRLAKRRLAAGHRLVVAVQVRSAGARTRTVTVRLARTSS